MYAIIKDGGHQYRVETGQVIRVQRKDLEPGSSIQFGEVLLIGGEGATRVGNPCVGGAAVEGTVLAEVKGEKVVGGHFRRRTRYRRKFGHRQKYSTVRIDGIRG